MHLLVVANETVTGRKLIEPVERHQEDGLRVTVIAPVNQPERGYVVYEDTRRAAAGRGLEPTWAMFREGGIAAHGLVVESDPVTAVRDALAQLEPPVDAVIVATHPQQKSGWLRKNVIDRIHGVAGERPVEHVVVDVSAETGQRNVLVIANETVLGDQLLNKIRQRATRGTASFLIVSPQSDPAEGAHPEAERRLKQAVAELRGEGIDVHGQVAHPDPFSAALEAIREERVDEMIVSTYGPEKSGWLRRDLIERLRNETSLPVEHVMATSEVPAWWPRTPKPITGRRSRTRARASTHRSSGCCSSSRPRSCFSARSSPRTSSCAWRTASRGRPRPSSCPSSSPASTRRSSSPRPSRCTGRCSRSSAATVRVCRRGSCPRS